MRLAIFGASGFAREVLDIALVLGYEKVVFIDKSQKGTLNEFTIVTENEVYSLNQANYKFVIGIGNPAIRKEIYNKFSNLEYVNVIHPTATFGFNQLKQVEAKVGNIICAGTRMTNNIKIGNFGIYYLNTTIAHDCIIEDFVTILSGANISGNVKLSTCSYIGTNACILQGKSTEQKLIIGQNSIVGAGAVVTKNVSNNAVVKGVPAK